MSFPDDAALRRLSEQIEELENKVGPERIRSATAEHFIKVIEDFKRQQEAMVKKANEESPDSERKKNEQANALIVAYLVQRESALTELERNSYQSFLEKDFFTKSDFDSLDKFYGSAWDRLSERGKAEMSHRVWEGIRQGEYEFTDLPQNVRDKEMERLYGFLSNPEKMPENLKQIPEKDRDDFVAAYSSGDTEKAAQLLNLDSFKENVSLERKADDRQATKGRDDCDKSKVLDDTVMVERKAQHPTKIASTSDQSELSSLKL